MEGDQRAMKTLVEKYKKKAYYLALGMVGNSDEAFDISQEAFIRVYKSAKGFDRSKTFFPWFYSIIVNLCKDCLARRERLDSKMVNLDDTGFLLIDSATPESKVIREEQARLVREALMKLDFDDREILVLKHFRDMPYDEIARLLKIPKGTVMSRLYYARKKLAKLINE
jgi:RNA polymerase sigma-70 factor (ECF subfamily)